MMKNDLLVTILYDKQNKGRQIYRIEEDMEYQYEDININIVKGFKTDLASIPRLLKMFVTPTGRWATASIFHDFLYKTRLVPRDVADKVFEKIMISSDVAKWQRIAGYTLVRLFGWFVYYRKGNVELYRKYGNVEYLKS